MDFYTFATDLAQEAAAHLQQRRHESFSVSNKNDNPKDIVTSLDIAMGDFITSRIQSAFPDHGIHNEEAAEIEGNDYLWVIDPIDGSAVFARAIPQYAISIGLVHEGQTIVGAVIDPSTMELFSFEKGRGVFLNGEPVGVSDRTELKECFMLLAAGRKEAQREWAGESLKILLASVNKTKNFGSSALSLSYIASGRIEGVVAGTFTTIDIAAAVGMLREAGGEIVDEHGEPVRLRKEAQKIFAANSPALAEELRQLIG